MEKFDCFKAVGLNVSKDKNCFGNVIYSLYVGNEPTYYNRKFVIFERDYWKCGCYSYDKKWDGNKWFKNIDSAIEWLKKEIL